MLFVLRSFVFLVLSCLGISSLAEARTVLIDADGLRGRECVEPGGIILTSAPISKFRLDLGGKELYIFPVPLTVSSLDGYSICDKEFPTERIRLRKKREKIDEDILAMIRQQKMFLKSIYLAEPMPKMWEGNFIFPMKKYKRNRDNFGARRTINDSPPLIHKGLDISASAGEKVYASNSGIVVVARRFILEGNTVIINHGNGIYTIYAHLKRITVREGEFVRKGQLIGYVGSTGRSTGPHLHFGAKIGETDINPYILLEIHDYILSAVSQIYR